LYVDCTAFGVLAMPIGLLFWFIIRPDRGGPQDRESAVAQIVARHRLIRPAESKIEAALAYSVDHCGADAAAR
jgi:hypothetical protein